MNCLQVFPSEISRDKHFEYCKDNETVRIEMPKEGSFVKFHDGQYQFKVPYIMYTDLEEILESIEGSTPSPEESYTKEINKYVYDFLFCFVMPICLFAAFESMSQTFPNNLFSTK